MSHESQANRSAANRSAANRNWRVHFVSPVPTRWHGGAAPRQMTIQLVTDFGETVSDAGNEGAWDSDGPKGWDSLGDSVSADALDSVKLSLSLAMAEDLSVASSYSAGVVLRVWEDRSMTSPLDPDKLSVGTDSTCKVWVSLEESTLKSERNFDGMWLRLKGASTLASACPIQEGVHRCRTVCRHHAGSGEVLPIWSSAFRFVCMDSDKGDACVPNSLSPQRSYFARIVQFSPALSRVPSGAAATITEPPPLDAETEPPPPLAIVLYEDTKARGTGGNVWDVAQIMSHVLVHRFGGSMRGLAILELGAGAGLPGLVCARLGAKVVLTDNAPDVLRLLAANAAALKSNTAAVALTSNTAVLLSHAAALKANTGDERGSYTLNTSSPPPCHARPAPGPVSICSLEWGEDAALQLGTSRIGCALESGSDASSSSPSALRFDLILASEVAYCEAAIAPLVLTMRELATEATHVLLGFRHRDEQVEDSLRALLGAFFRAELVAASEFARMPPFCRQSNVEMYWCRKREDAHDAAAVGARLLHCKGGRHAGYLLSQAWRDFPRPSPS